MLEGTEKAIRFDCMELEAKACRYHSLLPIATSLLPSTANEGIQGLCSCWCDLTPGKEERNRSLLKKMQRCARVE
jgi:hypothetical protein